VRILLPYGIEHHTEHAEPFWTWAGPVRTARDAQLAAHIEEAVCRIGTVSRDLEEILKHIGAARGDHAHLDHEHLH
jgi:hypothetical protein